MRIFEINGGVFGSTGRIMFGIAKLARKEGMDVLCASPITSTNRNRSPEDIYVKVGSYNSRRLSVFLGWLTGYNGCFAIFNTMKLLKKIKEYNPDIIHLHNIHNSFVNIPMLTNYLKQSNIRVIWTLHDCWSFTGQCPYFTIAKCEKWRAGCYHCGQYKDYPASLYDNTKKMWQLKKKWFTGINNMLIVTPSKWLAGLVKQSFLAEYPVEVINNGINTKVFRPTKSDFRNKYNIPENAFVILGVAFSWGARKGLDVFIDLAKKLDEVQYQIVLVGTNNTVDRMLPKSIISIHSTQNQKELAEIYSASDLFVNPTREENYPTVNMEAISCGTPVLTYETGGSPEIISKETGRVVPVNDIDKLIDEIIDISKTRPFDKKELKKAADVFGEEKRLGQYVKLYAKYSK